MPPYWLLNLTKSETESIRAAVEIEIVRMLENDLKRPSEYFDIPEDIEEIVEYYNDLVAIGNKLGGSYEQITVEEAKALRDKIVEDLASWAR